MLPRDLNHTMLSTNCAFMVYTEWPRNAFRFISITESSVLSDMLIVDVKSCVPQVSVFGPLLFSLCFCETRLVLLSVYHLLIQSFLQCIVFVYGQFSFIKKISSLHDMKGSKEREAHCASLSFDLLPCTINGYL